MKSGKSVLLLTLMLLVWCTPIHFAQENTCPQIVQDAVASADATCMSIERNQLCYGHQLVDAVPNDTATAYTFEQPGDVVDVTTVQSLSLSPMDAPADLWGVALMDIQPNLPDILPGQNVVFVLFGDVQLENVGDDLTNVPTIDVSANGVNLRSGPSTSYEVVGTLSGNAVANGRLEDGTWLRLQQFDEKGRWMWVATSVISVDGDIDTLNIVDAPYGDIFYGPMQAFYFTAGIGDSSCAESPHSGMLIQTPKGMGEVALNVNGLDIVLGSTLYIRSALPTEYADTSQTTQPLNIAVLEGQANYGGSTLNAGLSQIVVPVDGQLTPIGTPQPYDIAEMRQLPVDLLPNRVDILEHGTFNSTRFGGDIVYHYYPPLSNANGCAALLLHNARADNTSWDWLTGPLLDQGYSIYAPDMPGHGQTGGVDNWSLWPPVTDELVPFMQSQGYDCGIFIGSSIGANTSINACAAWPEWCNGAVLLSPGLDWGVPTLGAMSNVGDTPIYILAGQSDGSSASTANQLAGQAPNVTTQIYETDLHGSYMSDEFPLADAITDWLSTLDITR